MKYTFFVLVLLLIVGCNPPKCNTSWQCNPWSECIANEMSRYCWNACGDARTETLNCNSGVVTDDTLLIITTEELVPFIQPLVDYRNQRYNVIVHTPSNPTITDLKNLIMSILGLTHVFIVGDNTLIPSYSLTDNSYVDFDNNMYPEIAIGRLPLNDGQAISQYVQKVLAYEMEAQYNMRNSVFIGGSEPVEAITWKTCTMFEEQIYPIWNMPYEAICCNCENTNIYCTTNTAQLIQKINNGVLYVTFKGHGNPYVWTTSCGGDSFDVVDIPLLQNTRYPVAISMSCTTSILEDQYSLVQSSLPGQHGFIAFVGATEPTGGFDIWAADLFTYLQTEKTLGGAVLKAKQNQPTTTLVLNQHIMGDPTLTINANC